MSEGGYELTTTSGENIRFEEAMAALEAVKVKHFTAAPSTIGPFGESTISWEVTVPRKSDVSVFLDIEGTSVATSGGLLVTPDFSTTYRLRAQALGFSRVVATVAVHVELGACVTLTDAPTRWIAGFLPTQLRSDQHLISPPDVTIQGDRMTINVQILQDLYTFKKVPLPPIQASVSVVASFTLGVTPMPISSLGKKPRLSVAALEPRTFHTFHELSAENKEIAIDISAPWYLWLIPGAMIALPIAISNAEEKATKQISDALDVLVADQSNVSLDTWFKEPPSVQRPRMDKHDAGFYVNSNRDQVFWITFCPVPPGSAGGVPPLLS